MRRILLQIWIFGLAFGLGISVSALWGLYKLYRLPQVSAVIVSNPPLPPFETPPLEIVLGASACGPKANYLIYIGSDGSRITTSCESFTCSRAAAHELQMRLGKAEVAERSENLDEEGRPIGENVLVITPNVLRLSTNGRSLCVTEAPSLRHLQLLEGKRSP